jgi:hypothetical protein
MSTLGLASSKAIGKRLGLMGRVIFKVPCSFGSLPPGYIFLYILYI